MKVISKEILFQAPDTSILKMLILSPEIAKKALPGQFVVLMVSKEGERVPLTIVDKDLDKGTVTIIFQQAGATTSLLAKLKEEDSVYALAGPLGHPTEIQNYGKVILVGGGANVRCVHVQ